MDNEYRINIGCDRIIKDLIDVYFDPDVEFDVLVNGINSDPVYKSNIRSITFIQHKRDSEYREIGNSIGFRCYGNSNIGKSYGDIYMLYAANEYRLGNIIIDINDNNYHDIIMNNAKKIYDTYIANEGG